MTAAEAALIVVVLLLALILLLALYVLVRAEHEGREESEDAGSEGGTRPK